MSTETKAVLENALRSFNDPSRRNAYFDLYAPEIVLHGYAGSAPESRA